MSLLYTRLSALPVSESLATAQRIVVQGPTGLEQAPLPLLKTWFTADVNARIDSLEVGGTGPSIWPTARQLSLTGMATGAASFDGSQDVALEVTVPDAALTTAKVAGLGTTLLGLRTDVDAKAPLNHTHGTTLTQVNTNTYADIPVGPSIATSGTELPVNYSAVFTFNGGSDRTAQFAVGSQSDEFYWRGFRNTNGGWQAWRRLWHAGNFDPTLKANLASPSFTGTTTTQELHVAAATAGSHAIVRLRDQSGGNQGMIWWDRTNDWIRISRNNAAGGGIEGDLVLTATDLQWNGNNVYHAGNLNLSTKLDVGAAGVDYMTTAPIYYNASASQNCDNFTPGRYLVARENTNVPAQTEAFWYIETLRTYLDNNSMIQRAYGYQSGEMWTRYRYAGVWGAWRRVWDNTNLSTANYLTTGAFGLGSTSIVNNTGWNTVTQTGFYRMAGDMAGGAPADGADHDVLHIQSTGGDASQLAFTSNTTLSFRVKDDGSTWGAWRSIYHTGNFNPATKWDVSEATTIGLNGASGTTDFNTMADRVRFFRGINTAANRPADYTVNTSLYYDADTAGQLSVRVGDGDGLYFRRKTAATWQAWRTVWHDGNLDGAALMMHRGSIGGSVDIDTYQSTGTWHQPLNANTATGANYPVALAGRLDVYFPTTSMGWQEYTAYNNGARFRRAFYNNVWTGWIQQHDTGNLDLSTVVRTGSAQTIGGTKTFTAVPYINVGTGLLSEFRFQVDSVNVGGMFSDATRTAMYNEGVGDLVFRPNGRGSTAYQVIMNQSGMSWNGQSVWHAGNLNTAAFLSRNASGTTQSGVADMGVVDNSITTGVYWNDTGTTGAPTTQRQHWWHSRRAAGGGEAQLSIDETSGTIYSRARVTGAWTPWRTYYHNGNLDLSNYVNITAAQDVGGLKTFTYGAIRIQGWGADSSSGVVYLGALDRYMYKPGGVDRFDFKVSDTQTASLSTGGTIWTANNFDPNTKMGVTQAPFGGSPSVNDVAADKIVHFKSDAATMTGALVLVAPSGANAVMHRINVRGVNYTTGRQFDLSVVGYKASATSGWTNMSKIVTGREDTAARWGITPDGRNCLILGDVNTNWSYFHMVADGVFGYTGASAAYGTGWTTALATDLSAYTYVTSVIPNTFSVTAVGTTIGDAGNEARYSFNTDDWYYFSNPTNMGWYSTANGYGLRLTKATKAVSVFGAFDTLGDITVGTNTGNLNFLSGAITRQMVNLWGSAYGVGVQNNTEYFRTGGGFAWFRGGVHSATQFDPGAGGAIMAYLDSTANFVTYGALYPGGPNGPQIAGDATRMSVNKELTVVSSNALRMVGGNYGAILRQDGTNFYFLMTASGDQYGSWNALRPLQINMASGAVTVGTQVDISGHCSANRFFTGYDSGVANSFSCSGWFRSNGDSGWFNSTYGGGWYMTDTTYVRTYGSKQVAAADFVISSDRNLKTNIVDLKYAGRLRPVHFQYREDGRHDFGFIAQEVQALYPEAVGKLGEHLQLSYHKLTAVLSHQINHVEDDVEAIKVENTQLKAKVDQLEESYTGLRNELDTLKEQMADLLAKMGK